MEGKSDRLLLNLVDEPEGKGKGKGKGSKGKVSFMAAMQQMGIESVFDIIGQSETQFVERLGDVCEADGALAYENARCYAVQIGRLYREHRVSSGNAQDLTQRTGVRALVDVGPSYPNLFKDNWDKFCQVGALAALDSPVAYLSSLFRFATRTLETSGQGNQAKILLSTRRPDIAGLMIDQHSTFTARPMLELVNDTLIADIKRYLVGKPDANTPIYELLAKRRHPFMFPYYYPHHQCRLGLAEKKLELGELNYRVSLQLPIRQQGLNDYGAVQNASLEAQRLLTGLSPQQQTLLIEPSLFTTFYLSRAELAQAWSGPGTSHLRPHAPLGVGFLLHSGQPAVVSVAPPATTFSSGVGNNQLTLKFSGQGSEPTVQAVLSVSSATPLYAAVWRMNALHGVGPLTIIPHVSFTPSGQLPVKAGYSASFTLTTTSGPANAPVGVAAFSFTVQLEEQVRWTPVQQAFFRHSYGLAAGASGGGEMLIELKRFMGQTELDADQVEALLSQRKHAPRLSPNCPSTNQQHIDSNTHMPYPHASQYGACYVNGHGSDRYDSASPQTLNSQAKDRFDNSMGLKEDVFSGRTTWYLTKTSPNRFDRLQRMIRLQRWLDIPFAELDTLLVSGIRSEGQHNLTLDLNINTLRVIGVYRYFSRYYSITPEEFAAFLHDITPYATGGKLPLFDQVFNRAALFDAPLVLNQQLFTHTGTDAASKKTVSQLCAGLGLQATETSFFRLAGQTRQHVGPLRRDLATVSSLYRQARIPQLFGLSAEDGWALVDLLGRQDYHQLLCTGRLAQQTLRSLKPMAMLAQGEDISLKLVLVADVQQEGDLLRLLPGSELSVQSGADFATSTASRLFTLEREPSHPDVADFLMNPDGSPLTLDPVSAGGTLSISNKTISRAAWAVITTRPAPTLTLRVKCGGLPKRALTSVTFTEEDALASPPDILDVLMQMDWAVTWLKDSKHSITDVRRLLGLDPGDYLPPQGLIDRLAVLAGEAREVLVTNAQIQALNLPAHELARKAVDAGAPIDWRAVLLPLLDAQGLVKALPLVEIDDPLGQLQAALRLAVRAIELSTADRERCVQLLGNLLLTSHDRQLRLIEGLAQEMVNLPMDRTQVVLRWAQTSVYALLSAVLAQGIDAGPADPAQSQTLLDQLQRVLRHAQAALNLRLGTSALRLFLLHPEWLGVGDSLPLSLNSFYLLSRYSQWFSGQSQAEEALLGYFITANPRKARLKTKAQRSAVNDEAASVLARLLGWHKDEVHALFQQLPQRRACSMAEVDWVQRCHATSTASGLPSANLLQATALHGASAGLAWQAVSEAVMVASR